ncbi:pancreatic triacylglycerol lipase-like isoform X2 [Palaemon carinicauda]|uniref:pancreatic triacylglycerol lipase-like isoform X2 n=1 Tax=Palaemon carinicauda TaxID=392227 RepID=UPI0035B68356
MTVKLNDEPHTSPSPADPSDSWPTQPDSPDPVVEEEPDQAMEPSWSLFPRALLAGLAALVALLVFHPSLVNLLVRSENTLVPLNYVTGIHLWSSEHRNSPFDLVIGSQLSLAASRFYPQKTYIIVHGFMGSGRDDWIVELKDALLKREYCNVISVTWSAGSYTVSYFVIQEKVPSVGDDISKLLLFLIDGAGLSIDKIHLIGHSLGAHVVGYAGKKMNGSLSRITGLDPAGLMFHAADITERLDKSDATFVDVIHTHGCTTIMSQWTDCYGIDENIGDADFWPNGGQRQPACTESGDGNLHTKEGSSCDHAMAYILYTESIRYSTYSTKFLARPCISWPYFNNGSCPCSYPGSTVQYMGYNVNPLVSGVFYLNTSMISPYALSDDLCFAGFSVLQLIGLILISILTLIMMLFVVAAVVQQYYGIPILTRLSSAMGCHGGTWHGLQESSSSELLAAAKENEVMT